LGVDVGTGSVRAALFDANGRRLGMGVQPIGIHRPADDLVEQSSDEIWRAAGIAIRAALAESGLPPSAVAGLGFDATCSLVVLDASDQPVSLSPSGDDAHNVMVWMDHRATAQAERINARGHDVLRYVGGVISPEMQTPKLLWLREEMPHAFARAARFLDLPDFLAYRATGRDVRSLCTTVCKWTYLGHERRWDASYFEGIGLGALAKEGFARIGTDIRPMGERIGSLRPQSALELGLHDGVAVAVPIIDAHAGGVGMLGVPLRGQGEVDHDTRLSLICGTSSCHMAVAREPRFIEGIWGPYHSAMVPGLWLTEGGQSATGALIDHIVLGHPRAAELQAHARASGTTIYALLNEVLAKLAVGQPCPAALSADVHVYPDFHGNRSPRADASLRGMVSGLRLSDSASSLAVLYLATVQALAYGTRHIIEQMNASGFAIDTLIACGGDTRNALFLREHADITGCRVVLPSEPEAVLLGAAMLGAVSAGAYPDVQSAMAAMSSAGATIEPASGPTAAYHAGKYRVFQRMHDDQLAYRALIAGPEATPQS
jgi:FGGY-family pentulose kinase